MTCDMNCVTVSTKSCKPMFLAVDAHANYQKCCSRLGCCALAWGRKGVVSGDGATKVRRMISAAAGTLAKLALNEQAEPGRLPILAFMLANAGAIALFRVFRCDAAGRESPRFHA